MATELFRQSDINITDPVMLKKLIAHIEINISGKLSEVIRILMHFELIFGIIAERGNVIGPECLQAVETEILQFQTVFNINSSKLEKLIVSNDYKQYNKYTLLITKKKRRIETLKDNLYNLLIFLKKIFIKSVEHNLRQFDIPIITNKIIATMKKMNTVINDINIHFFHIPWIIEPNIKTTKAKNKSFLCAASVFQISREEYSELIEDTEIIKVHVPTRRFKCVVNSASLERFIDECFKTSYPKIIDSETIILQSDCPSTKPDGSKCGCKVSIDDLCVKVSTNSMYKLKIQNKKQELIKKIYGLDIYAKCPKPDCPNGDGFPISTILTDILNGDIKHVQSPIHNCELCNSVWCSKCGKIHPGRLCDDDEDELGPDVKKCPGCYLPTIREGGCFHMNCTRCNIHWCWECNNFTPQSDAYSHNCITGNWLLTANV